MGGVKSWSMDTRCPVAPNTGSVGSCKFTNCDAARGPTHCSWGSCYCNEGYCRYPASTVHIQSRYCVARAGDATCHATRFCYSGGLSETFCESGYCMCKWGYRWDDSTGACVSSGSELAEAIASNATQA